MVFSMRFLLSILLLCGLPVGLLRAAVVSEPPVATVTENSAVVRWATDVECGTTLKIGTSASELNRKLEGGIGKKHEVAVNGLLPSTQYYFSIGTSKKTLQNGIFTTKGERLGGIFSKRPVPDPSAPPATKPAPPAIPLKPAHNPPPTSKTWGDRSSLQDHFHRHGADFKATSADDYAARAWLFLQRAMDDGLPAKQDEDGTIRVWEPKSRTFAAYNRNFTTKTYFRPNSSDYFQRQPGKPVRLKHAPPTP